MSTVPHKGTFLFNKYNHATDAVSLQLAALDHGFEVSCTERQCYIIVKVQ